MVEYETECQVFVCLVEHMLVYEIIKSDWLLVKVDCNRGCMMSAWLFNISMDGVVREVNVRS